MKARAAESNPQGQFSCADAFFLPRV